jgi:hypothetical protein
VKLVPGKAGDDRLGKVAGAPLALDQGRQARRDHGEHLIAVGMAEAVIHFLEAIEINKQQCELLARLPRLQEPLGLPLELDRFGRLVTGS